ncbi:hypothetical protein [Natronococcus wangiae]|uniref:hypothetical protein n=1 Tax=Natronococcus wangiae TaxID=3068275 RepID=UPI00273FFD91|nr:hypothetical protein [Natronococcus sp. AD5]
MTEPDLRPFVARSRALVSATPPDSRRETRTWLVEPFLEALGWSARDESRTTDRALDGTRIEYVLAADSVPAVLVAVGSYAESLDESRATALLETMAWTGIDRAIYTNGREYLLLAGTTSVERLACGLSSLPGHESALRHYTRENARRRFEDRSRTAVARRLAVERPAVESAIVEQLVAVTGDDYADEFEAAADRFLDRLVVSFAEEERNASVDRDGIPLEYSESPLSNGEPNHVDGDRTENGAGETQSDRSPSSNGDSCDDTETDAAPDTELVDDEQPGPDRDGGGEYVVRFFNDRGSIGAIGHSSAARALTHAAEYCLERGLAGVSVPWSPSDGDTETVLNDEPIRGDGSPMASPRQLSNGYYLETDGSVDEQASRIEALASRAGLRAMLTGDWE